MKKSYPYEKVVKIALMLLIIFFLKEYFLEEYFKPEERIVNLNYSNSIRLGNYTICFSTQSGNCLKYEYSSYTNSILICKDDRVNCEPIYLSKCPGWEIGRLSAGLKCNIGKYKLEIIHTDILKNGYIENIYIKIIDQSKKVFDFKKFLREIVDFFFR